jgi:hypothetical protein
MSETHCKLQIANCKLQSSSQLKRKPIGGLTPPSCLLLAALVLFLTAPALSARTIVLTDEDCDDMAVISEDTPNLSWAMYESSTSVWSNYVMQLTSKRAVLVRYPLDKIPKGQRITSAEWVVPLTYIAGTPHWHLRRVLVDWGIGVCHKYRLTYPKKVKWSKPGARGISSDRALKPTAKAKLTEELWYSGGAANNGWILSEENDGITQISGPLSPWVSGKGKWKLRITYEPK